MKSRISKIVRKATKLILVCSFNTLLAQGITENFPRTPESSSLGKFTDIPVGKFTGTVQTSIPIYVINVDDIQIPIELNYHASGIKVDDIASRVGLGWTLNHGASISKETVGFPDNTRTRPSIDPLTFNPNVFFGTLSQPTIDTEVILASLGYSFLSNALIPTQPIDTQPDLYSYNILNNSGRFSFNSDGKAILIPQTDLKLLSDDISVHNFNFLDSKGNKFEFWPNNIITNRNSNQVISHVAQTLSDSDSWEIRKIITKNNNEITYEYAKRITTIIESNNIIKKSKTVFSNGSGCLPLDFSHGSYSFTPKRRINSGLLTKISFPNGYINFSYSDDVSNRKRLDLENDVFLEKIEVYNTNGTLLKRYELMYDYFYNNSLSQHFDGNRLKLTNVKESLSGQKYSLEYYNDKKIPKRLTEVKDQWGYFNNNLSGDGIPSIFFNNRYYPGANREVKEEHALNGLLKQITYPTKGKSSFIYELDDYYDEWTEKHFESGMFSLNTYGEPNGGGIQSIYKKDITIAPEMTSFTLVFNNSRTQDDTTPVGFPAPCQGSFFNKDTGEFIIKNQHNSLNNSEVFLAPGTYEMSLKKNDDDFCNMAVRYNIVIEEQKKENRKGGGVRIKEIITEDPVMNSKLIKKYNYNFPGSEKSSGVMIAKQPSFTKLRTEIVKSGLSNTTCQYLDLQNTPVNAYSGKPIAYEYVTEINIDPIKNEHNSIVSKYKAWPSDLVLGDTYEQLDMPTEYNDFQRGLLLEEIHKDNNDIAVLKQEFEYKFDDSFNFNSKDFTGYDKVTHGMVGKIQEIDKKATNNTVSFNIIFDWNFYYIRNLWVQNTLIRTTNYLNGQPSLINEELIDYQLKSPKHTFPISQRTTNSLGDTLKTEYQYPPDLPNKPQAEKLISANRISEPLVVKSYNNGNLVSQQETVYGDFIGLTLPKFVYAKKGAYPEEKKISYDWYDNKGNLMQYTLENGIPISIIWGYNGQYPIAKVEGVRYIDIHSLAQDLIDLSNSGSLDETSFNTLRNTENLMITGYTYDPLIGVTSIIQPNGQVEYYEYDTAGRLEYIKDHNGKVIKRMEYHYKN